MKKQLRLLFLVIILIMVNTKHTVFAASIDIYVSPTGSDLNPCTANAPCKTIQKGVDMVQAGGILHILAGTYSESVSVSKTGTQSQPIRIIGENAILSNGGQLAFSVRNSQWLSFEGFTIKGYTLSIFEIRLSHFLTFKNNVFDYTFAAIRIKDGVSHILVENNEMYQSYPAGSTWSSLKGSKYEGGGVYASTGGQGMYLIRNNYFHDSVNGIYIWDTDAGPWMNANIFISGNTFRNIVDDPFEPEGDSFNLHFYNNTLINTHRIASIVPDAACIGPIFVYGNYQQNNLDPTGEASAGRLNSAIKMDMGNGTCPNGVWVFNNTVNANVAGTNFHGVDLIDSSVKNYNMLNNVFVTEKNAYSGTPRFTNSFSDYNISLKPFGYVEPHGLQADPLLNEDGTLQAASPAVGRSAPINLSTYFATSQIVPFGANAGTFMSFPAPKYVLPPGGEPSDFPANMEGWPDLAAAVTPVSSFTPTISATNTSLPTATWTPTPQTLTETTVPTNTPLITPTVSAAVESPTPTPLPDTPTSLPTFTSIPPTAITVPVFTNTPFEIYPTATVIPPTATTISIPTGNETTYDDKNSAFRYSENWQDTPKPRAYDGSFKLTQQKGSFVIFGFTGQSFSIIFTTGKNYGRVDVYVDNQLVSTIDQKTGQNQFQQRWDYPGTLSPGTHELKLVFEGPRKSKISLDAVIVR